MPADSGEIKLEYSDKVALFLITTNLPTAKVLAVFTVISEGTTVTEGFEC
jgi:hypothetical protein